MHKISGRNYRFCPFVLYLKSDIINKISVSIMTSDITVCIHSVIKIGEGNYG
jgi:hypothetical protein